MGGAVKAVTQPFVDIAKSAGGNVSNLVKDAGGSVGRLIGGDVGSLIKDTTGNVGNLVKDSTSSDLSQDLIRAAVLAGGAYYAAPYLSASGSGTAAAGTGTAGSSGVIGAGPVVTGYAGTTPLTMANTGSLLTGTSGAVGNAGLLTGASSFSGLGTGATTMATPSFFDTALSYGSSALDFAKANPQLTGSLLGSVTGALSAANAPTSQTATTSIDPQIKAEYLANLERAKATAAGLQARRFEGFTPDYLQAEQQIRNLGLGGKGQQTIDETTRRAMIEAGFTPQQIQAAQANRGNVANVSGLDGSRFMSAYQNPFEEQVVQGALGDIERSRQMQEQANMAQATAAKAFGGSRQGIVSGLTNEAALRQAATTSGQLRSAGFTQAAQLGQNDAARQLQAQLANQGVDVTLEQANAQMAQQAALANQNAYAQGAGVRQSAIGQLGQLGSLQQNLGFTGSNAVMEAQARQQALNQSRLDAARNLELERLGITSGALGLQPANTGGTSTTPLYSSTLGSALGGALSGAYIGSLLQPKA